MKICSLRKNIDFEKKKLFQIDITSSDLNEFWIGQKIWKAESLLFHLSTLLWGFEQYNLLSSRKKNPAEINHGFFSQTLHIPSLGAPIWQILS